MTNPVALVHFIVGSAAVVLAQPLIARRVKMNGWYGVRIPAAFASDARWYEINEYGGRLLRGWGCALAGVGAVGMFVPKAGWVAYDWSVLAFVAFAMTASIWKLRRFIRRLP